MKISATLQPLIDATRREVPSLLQQLRVGQLLQAKVLQQVQPGLLRMQIANLEVLARSQLAAAPGAQLRLEVVKPYPLPELRVVRLQTAAEQRQQVARVALARQLPPAEVRERAAVLRPAAASGRPADLLQQLNSVLRQGAVDARQPSAAQIQRAVAQSGLFHEARLAAPQVGTAAGGTPAAGATPATPPGDIKLQLLQLLGQAQAAQQVAVRESGAMPGSEAAGMGRDPVADSLLARLVRLIEGSVARIQLQQAASLPADDGPRQAWQLDIPIQLPDERHEAMMRIERDGAREEDGAPPTWAINLAFEFATIGTLQCRIALAGERLSTTFWCDRQATLARVEARLPSLESALQAQGFEIVHIAGVLGAPPEPLFPVPVPETLLDERA